MRSDSHAVSQREMLSPWTATPPTTVPRAVPAEVGFRCPVAGRGSPDLTGSTSTRRGASDTTTSSQARSRFDLRSTRTVAGGRNRTGAWIVDSPFGYVAPVAEGHPWAGMSELQRQLYRSD
jgi:hypothetical protein